MEKELLEQGFQRMKEQNMRKLKTYYSFMKESYASSIDLLSIFSWNKNLPAFYKIISDFLWFIVYDKINKRWINLPPIGNYEDENLGKVFFSMESFFSEKKYPLIYTDVTEWMVPYFREYFTQGLEILDMEELKEYIYSMEEFKKTLEEQKKRYDYRYFLNKNQVKTVTLTKALEEDCLKILAESFCDSHPCRECEYGCLKDTLHNVLQVCNKEEGHGFIIYKEDVPIAYNIVSREKEQLVFHFKKNKRGFRGINEYIHKESIVRYGKDCTNINYTEDMGVDGLRKYKSNLCSFTLQSKLEIRIKERDEGRT